MNDRTTKLLLALVAAALWALLLRPLFSAPASAADPRAPRAPRESEGAVSAAASNDMVYVVRGGRIYAYQMDYTAERLRFRTVRGVDTKP